MQPVKTAMAQSPEPGRTADHEKEISGTDYQHYHSPLISCKNQGLRHAHKVGVHTRLS